MNTKHKCYYQVQHQMFVTCRPWTDFVVKGSNSGSLFIERVSFNAKFWSVVFDRLYHFFTSHMLPEIAYPRVKYGIGSFTFNDPRHV